MSLLCSKPSNGIRTKSKILTTGWRALVIYICHLSKLVSCLHPLTYCPPATLASLSFLEHTKHTPSLGPLHLLFDLLGKFFQIFWWLAPFSFFRFWLKWHLIWEVFPELLFKKKNHLTLVHFPSKHVSQVDMLCIYLLTLYLVSVEPKIHEIRGFIFFSPTGLACNIACNRNSIYIYWTE